MPSMISCWKDLQLGFITDRRHVKLEIFNVLLSLWSDKVSVGQTSDLYMDFVPLWSDHSGEQHADRWHPDNDHYPQHQIFTLAWETWQAGSDLVSHWGERKHLLFSAISGCLQGQWLMLVILRQLQAFCPTERWKKKSIWDDSTCPSSFITLHSDFLFKSKALFTVICVFPGQWTALPLR